MSYKLSPIQSRDGMRFAAVASTKCNVSGDLKLITGSAAKEPVLLLFESQAVVAIDLDGNTYSAAEIEKKYPGVLQTFRS